MNKLIYYDKELHNARLNAQKIILEFTICITYIVRNHNKVL